MREHLGVRRAMARAVALGLAAQLVMASGSATAEGPLDVPACATPPAAGPLAPPPEWSVRLDEDGVVAGYDLEIPGQAGPRALRLGPRAFVSDLVAGRYAVGERTADGTLVVVVDAATGCRVRDVRLPDLAFDVRLEADGDGLRFVRVEADGRRPLGVYRMSLDSAAEVEPVGDECTLACAPSDTTVETALVATLVEPRPVPVYPDPHWPVNSQLRFRWASGEAPPDWARAAIRAAAGDATDTKISKAAAFEYDGASDDTVRYGTGFPTACRYGIACASRDIPSWWIVRLRPHGTEYAWGTLRWCQRSDADGCFDIERTMLHEFGHVTGMAHPDDHGFRLAARKTVMHAVIPSRPKTGSLQHAYGTCDVAALQLAFDTPGSGAPISDCLSLATRLSLSASRSRVALGESVKLTAGLSIADRDGYGRLGGNVLRGRSVLLRYRAAGSDASWSTLWMKDGSTNGSYVATLSPLRDWELQAVFRAPDDEGLQASSSDVVVVRVDDCGSLCPARTKAARP